MIKVLDKHIADKIAAGEVIDRPVSIIKELLENSIDAGADTITVEIKNGGKSYIRVTDSGCGIDETDVEIAFMRHATSKINTEKDLDAITSLGFRGEALASIAAVSRVELITCTKNAKTGRKVSVEASQVTENKATGCPHGTTITVRDLFYNVPARQKFMGSDSAEARRITEMVSRIALAYSDIKFNLINGSKRVFSTQGKGNIFNSIISVYGNDTGKDLIPVESKKDDFMIKGFISSPQASAASRNRQIFCVNGRVISSRIIQEAVEKAYQEKIFGNRFPVAFLFLSIPPAKLDVNIHPTKKEIRFDDDYEVYDFVKEAADSALSSLNAVAKIRSKDIKMMSQKHTPHVISNQKTPSVHEKTNSYKEPLHKEPEGDKVNIKNILQTMRVQKESVKKMEAELENDTLNAIKEDKSKGAFDLSSLKVKGSIFNTYILATDGESFFMIDQHAAHERVFYEKLIKQYNDEMPLSQQLLLPINVGASASCVSSEEEWMPLLEKAGYQIELFGNNTYIVRQVPAFMSMQEAESFLKDMLSEFAENPDLKNQKIIDKLITKSCKSAVKGGDILHDDEIDALITQLKACSNPFSCPHGRPTFVRITKHEIEKMFKRV